MIEAVWAGLLAFIFSAINVYVIFFEYWLIEEVFIGRNPNIQWFSVFLICVVAAILSVIITEYMEKKNSAVKDK